MIDYINATTTFDCKDTIYFRNMVKIAEYNTGWQRFIIKGCEGLEVRVHQNWGILTLKGSIPYYWQGNNFTFSRLQFSEAINYLSTIIHLNLWQAKVNAFEYGVIMEVPMKPREYIEHHNATKGLMLNVRQKDKGNYRNWEDKNVKLKMYDAGKNIKMKQGKKRKDIIRNAGWKDDGYFLKWEVHYLKPEILNRGMALHLSDLINEEWNTIFKEDLYLQYQRLIPMKNILSMDCKKDLSTIDILVQAYTEKSLNDGLSLDEIKKALYARVNAESSLSKSDKDLRKRIIKKALDKLNESPESKWNLSEQIRQALDKC